MIYVFEFFIMVWWNSYEYFPRVLPIRYYDNVVGATVSNLLIVPALGTLVAVYRLRWGWIVLFATSLVSVEWLFTQLNIYEPHWWKKGYTWIGLVFFFYLIRIWLGQLKEGHNSFRVISLWMQAWSGVGTVLFIMSVLGMRYYQIGFFEDMYRDDVFTSSIMGILKSGVFAVFVAWFKKAKWRLLAPVLVFAVDLPLYYAGILMVNIPFWIYTVMYMVLAVLLLWWNSYAYRFLKQLSDKHLL
ncbi:hypothetical protein [Paenibacillus turpanensis]|uniref:hypothetical protein n=1 Tax=Paenibacillus turpanensis TaxID=2689078 RepID=UPI001409298D|nr:hypothetical protein [Paenibacillus turpanensis]